jgi:hypothetical protein
LSHDSGDFALRALDEARELFYAANLAYRATSNALNAAPLLERSLIHLLAALAALEDVTSPEQSRILDAAMAVDERERLLGMEMRPYLDALHSLAARSSTAWATANADETAKVDELLAAMPRMLGSAAHYLQRRGHREKPLLGRRARMAIAGAAATLVASAGIFAAVKRHAESARGLRGVYFADVNFEHRAFERQDPKIDFAWNEAAPDDALPADGFSVRWEGMLRVPETGEYTFYLFSDDGARLFLDGHLVIDNWGNHSAVERDGTIELESGKVPIRVEYFENAGPAVVRLSWSSKTQSRSVIPAENLGQ